MTKPSVPTRRQLLQGIGRTAGATAMYGAMTQLGLADPSPSQIFRGLHGAKPGGTVVLLGAGLAGLVSAYELQRAGYQVQLLEYNQRAGGRCWTLRGGDQYAELGGNQQTCDFDTGQYFNPGPWRIPHHHHGVLHYCKQLGVDLQPFIQVNHSAYLHSRAAMGGKPQRFREILADYQGGVNELLAKVVQQQRLDQGVTPQDQAILLESLREVGALDRDFRYQAGTRASDRRGFFNAPGAGLSGRPTMSQPIGLHDVLQSGLWDQLSAGQHYEMQMPLFQPIGGMDHIAKALARTVEGHIRYGCKVVKIDQDASGVTVSYERTTTRTEPADHARAHVRAQWCVCALPLSVLSQIEMQVRAPLREAIDAVPYAAAIKVGLQFKRRFWEEDESIYGGVTSTDLPIRSIAYPSHDFQGKKGVLLGAYTFGANAYEFTAMTPAERIRQTVQMGSQVHPQYQQEFENGISVGWHRVPFTLGCFAAWNDALRTQHYDTLCRMDNRLVLAGEHASYLPAWQEGAVLSAWSAIEQLHQRAIAA